MKRRFIFLTLLIPLLLVSFKKKTVSLQPYYYATGKPAFYSSGWEGVAEWSLNEASGSKNYFFNRSTPELTQAALDEGAVMVYAKGYDFEGFSKSPERPLSLPFYFLSTDEQSPHAYAWRTENSAGSIKVSLHMHDQLEKVYLDARQNIKLRYIILSKDFLQKHHLTTQSVRSKRYKELIGIMGIDE